MSGDWARLLGAGWGRWRGGWWSHRCLRRSGDSWELRQTGRRVDRWSSFNDAVRALWPRRTRRDSAPWAVGFLGYEEAVGDSPSPGNGVPGGRWLVEPVPAWLPPPVVDPAPRADLLCLSSLSGSGFCAAVTEIRQRIAAGDVYQVNLTRRFTVDGWSGSLAPLIDAAVAGGAPDYLAHFGCADDELVCASMELFLRRRGPHLETRPIKGTRRRGSSPDEDRLMAAELAVDGKEAAELAMVVDLERNDLGRVAVSGTVQVDDPGTVRTYACVHHRVARISARLDERTPWWEVLVAMAPGGSVTGCPKRAAMAVIAELEPVPRGPYTGALGVVAGNGDVELALPIRTAWRVGDQLGFAAGCGVVWESDAEREEAESRVKVAPWLRLAGYVCR